MAPLFFAFDRTTYQRLFPYHLGDLQTFPPNILEHLQKGFTVAINGGKGHAVALDEAHEMCVKQREESIQAMMEEIDKACLFPPFVQENRGLLNAFNQAKATPEQSFDMLNFRDIGSHDLENFINHFLLKQPSTTAPVRKNKLLTMVPVKKINKRAMNQKEKELKQITKCLRQRLTWCNRTGQSYNSTIEQ